MKPLKNTWRILQILAGLLLLPAACSYLPEDLPERDGLAIEETRDFIALEPEDAASLAKTGFIFYPGGLVDPHAYLGWAADFARSGPGHRVLIVKMPANLAVLNSGAARKILKKEDVQQWVIGGHSLGGAMACSMVHEESTRFEAMVLMASYPPESADLSDWRGEVLSLSGSNDLVVDAEKFEGGKELLPDQTYYYEILGGNHAGFGSYGPQEGDGEAGISVKAQQQIISASLAQFFSSHGLD